MYNRIVILGPNNVGKNTVGKIIKSEFISRFDKNYELLDFGPLLKKAGDSNSITGKMTVSDKFLNLSIPICHQALQEYDGYIIAGSPRMPDEAVHYFEEGLIDSMITMYADDVRLWQRAFRRYYECIQEKREPRPDDSPDAVEYRINAYNVHVKETIAYLRRLLPLSAVINLDANGSICDVKKILLEQLKKLFAK